MIIEDPEAFKTWLTAVLKPICDADPEALAKYVIALVKKDKSPDALHQSMVNQLLVFLQDETKPFVDQLFRTLETQDYIITPTIPNANPPNPQPLIKADIPTKAAVTKPIIPVAEIASAITETLNGKGVTPTVRREEEKKETRVDKDDKGRRRSKRRSLSRNRSRSRSWDRNRRSRSREKSRERLDKRGERSRGVWRNKSPWRHDRRRSVSPTGGRVRSRSRSPRHNYRGGGRYRNRSPPRSHSRSRSHSVDARRDGKEPAKEEPGNGTAPPPDAKPAGVEAEAKAVVPSAIVQPNAEARKRRCRDYDEEGYCMRGGMCPYDHGVDAVVLEDSALSRVLYPNGTNDSILGPPPNMPGHMMHARPPMPTEYNPQAPQMWHQRGPGGFRGGHRGGMNQGPPRMPMGPFPGGPQPIPPLPNMQQRELIAVPVLGTEITPMEKYGFNAPGPNSGYHPENMFKKKQFDFNRLGPRQKNPSNCSLELKKVPTGLNNITHLNNHFSKFGKIVNIQVSFEGDPEAAIVTFSSHAEANAAYRSTEAVLNNRFIKVFWHSGNAANTDPPKDSSMLLNVQRSVKERLGQTGGNVPPNANKFLNVNQTKPDKDKEKENTNSNQEQPEDDGDSAGDRVKELETKKEEIKAQQTLAIRKNQELLAAKEKIKKNHEEKRKKAIKLTQDLTKRKQDLLEKQIAQQKLLIEKMGKCPAGPQRDLLLQTIKKSQESIEVIRKDLAQAVSAMKPTAQATPVAAMPTNPGLLKRNKEAVQKELLDAELDLISKQAEGVDTSDLQKKLMDLKAKAGVTAAPIVSARGGGGRGRGARRFNPLSRHKLVKNNLTGDGKCVSPTKTTFQTHAVDHRPTRLLVSGYEGDEQENVLGHFRQFGEIVDYVSDDALPSVVVNYKTRKEAEIAFNKGKHFQDRTLSITWHNLIQIQRQPSRTVLISESDEDQLIDAVALLDGDDEMGAELSEDVLLQDDEEEEEENEDRSWRR